MDDALKALRAPSMPSTTLLKLVSGRAGIAQQVGRAKRSLSPGAGARLAPAGTNRGAVGVPSAADPRNHVGLPRWRTTVSPSFRSTAQAVLKHFGHGSARRDRY
jgi:hypothetical protein